ncbi:MAG: hypothetical protein U5S82_16575 [Gammaproteobacteria bacterium]|nr:hypothetical protein [Gammaproteobacteria bacterium]
MTAPSHRNRTAQEIVSEHIYHDAQGFGYRAASWLDLAHRSGDFAPFHYACIDARLSIEHLIFEQLVITAGGALDQDSYKRCLLEPRKLDKVLNRLVPDYDRLQEFNTIVGSLLPGLPRLNRWNITDLRKSWGKLSQYLHWSGAHPETTENPPWQRHALDQVTSIIDPLWQKISSGHTGSIALDSMPRPVREVWEDFRVEKIDAESVRIRLELVRPSTSPSHA